MRLYSGPMSMFGAKAQIAVCEKNVECETVMVPFGLRRRYDPANPEVVRINPKRQIPVLLDGHLELYDSTQIFEYLEDAYPDPPLWPRNAASRATARQLEHASDEIFFPQIVVLMRPGGEGRADALASAKRYYAQMDARVGAGYLAGPYGFADIAFFMASLFGEVLGAAIGDQHEALLDWRRRVAARDAVSRVVEPMLRYVTDRGVADRATAERILGRPLPESVSRDAATGQGRGQ